MDFLTLFGIYVVVVLTCIALVCRYSGQQHSPLNSLYSFALKVRKEQKQDEYEAFLFMQFQRQTLCGAVVSI